MPLRRFRTQYEQMSQYERCHLHEDQAQDALVIQVVEKTATCRPVEGHLESRRPFRELPSTPTHRRRRLEWCRARGTWTAAEWIQVDFSDEYRFNVSSDANRVRVWRPRGERLYLAFTLLPQTAPTAGVMVWGAIAYNIRSAQY
ncbi:transposable element Tcb1 transposase [Trichonephila clavipes]|uniref:Transposable element Tcb1 transposase n=1 Tax=Trichonephila clavipes TaxID=2585209 RepID=A0A8X6VET9_TRICX|nr:transposable element Tcb1 transposase [Trichonephila clavipes]